MKFIAKTLSKCAPRLGMISNVERLPEFQLETPAAILYTKGGSIPHITHEVLQLITTEPQCIQVPTVSTAGFAGPMGEFGRNIAEFCGLNDCLTCLTVQDPGNITPSGHHQQNSVPIWTKAGKMYLSADSYMDTVEAFKPDMYYLLSDGDTNISSSKKRISKSVDLSVSLFKDCLARHKKSDVLKNSLVLAQLEGGYCLKSRERYLTEILQEKDKIGGYVIDGLHNNGPEVELIKFDEINHIVEHSINAIPEDSMRILHGCWNPVVIIKLIKLGIDIFDTSYLYVLTKRSSALTFSFQPTEVNEYEINFIDARYSQEFVPIVEDCTCLTCTKYTRAYLHHLTAVQELLGPVLLMIHNIHHYLRFFKTIRQAIEDETLDALEATVGVQFDQHQQKILRE